MPLLVVVVPALPRSAAVELHVTAIQDEPANRTSCHMTTKLGCGSIEYHTVMSSDSCNASMSCSLTLSADSLEQTTVKELTETVGATFRKAMKKMGAELTPLCARVFYKCTHSVAQQIVEGMSLDMYLTQDAAHEPLLI